MTRFILVILGGLVVSFLTNKVAGKNVEEFHEVDNFYKKYLLLGIAFMVGGTLMNMIYAYITK